MRLVGALGSVSLGADGLAAGATGSLVGFWRFLTLEAFRSLQDAKSLDRCLHDLVIEQ